MRKLIAVVLALTVAMTMGIATTSVAFAANDGSITIQNTVKDKTYEVYKVFDATYSGDNVAYTYDGSNATFLAALQADSSPFTVKANTSGSYSVVKKDGVQDSAIIEFIKGQEGNFGTKVATKTGDGKTQTVGGLAYGYYYITTTTGTAVTIDSALKDVTVIDKNEELTVDKKESFDGTNWVVDGDTNIGDTIDYKVTGNINRYQGETLVTSLNFTDVMSAGLTLNKDVVIKVTSPSGTVKTLVAGTDYTVAYNGQTTTIDITTATGTADNPTFLFDTGSTYEITYSGKVNDKAVIDTTDTNKNTVTLKYNNQTTVGEKTTTFETYDFLVKKTDGTKFLDGAEFKLYDAATGGNQILLSKDATGTGMYKDPAGSADTTIDINDAAGVNVRGLAPGDYYLEEVVVPEGYNPPEGRTKVTVTTGQTSAVEITVVNKTGTELPSTGGIGTTIFYILGALLVVGCGIILIARRRSSAHN